MPGELSPRPSDRSLRGEEVTGRAGEKRAPMSQAPGSSDTAQQMRAVALPCSNSAVRCGEARPGHPFIYDGEVSTLTSRITRRARAKAPASPHD